MRIVIAGCGKVGTAILANLVKEGHEVVAMDLSGAVIQELCNVYDVIGVVGNCTDCDVLTEAGIAEASLYVAATGSDEINMLSGFLARRMGARHTVARIRQPEYTDQSIGFMKQQLDLSVIINPDLLAAQELFNILQLPGAVNVETFSKRNFEVVELIVRDGSPLHGMSLMEMRKKYPASFLVCAVQRGSEVTVPGGSFRLQSGDRIGLTASPVEIERLLKMLGAMQAKARSVMILGASRTAFYLSKMLLASGNRVTLIEADRDRCRAFAEALPDAVIIHGDGANEEILNEEGLGDTDAFVSLTGVDEENVLLSYFAQGRGVKKVITKVNRDEFVSMAEKMGLDSIISPKRTVTDVVTRYARALENSGDGTKMETLYKFMDGKAEAAEFKIREDFSHLDVPLKDLGIRENALIGGIVRGRKVLIPSGADCIQNGDRVIVVTTAGSIRDLSDVMA